MNDSRNNDDPAANDTSLEQLERTVREIEVLKAIYGSDHGDDNDDNGTHETHQFIVHSTQEMWDAQVAIGDEEEDEESDFTKTRRIPTLDIELRIMQESESSTNTTTIRSPQDRKPKMTRLRCKLVPGYPEIFPATIVCVTVDGLYRSQQENIALQLQEKAQALLGQEAIMELVQEVQELVVRTVLLSSKEEPSTNQESSHLSSSSKGYKSRQWIWAHHITNADRRKSIVNEAAELKLGGYLKSGYPGIVVVEGPSQECSEFVSWIKGSKSRPGGFGRNWGHHVKGEIRIPLSPPDNYDDGDHNVDSTTNEEKYNSIETTTPSQQSCQDLPIPFEDVGEDMKVLSFKCKEHGLEHEFLEYVMQHKGNN